MHVRWAHALCRRHGCASADDAIRREAIDGTVNGRVESTVGAVQRALGSPRRDTGRGKPLIREVRGGGFRVAHR